MADNIDEEHLENPTTAQPDTASEDIIPNQGTENINLNQETEIMEVHHYPDIHHKSKKWKEYLLEGFMIFVAVTMGFFAESYHINLVNKEIEKRNIKSFISNIQKDTANLSSNIKNCEYKIGLIDSLNSIPGDFSDTSFQKSFFNYAAKLIHYESYLPDESAFLQMQSSGTLRLINKQDITDSILKYHSENIDIQHQQATVNGYFTSSLDNLFQITDLRKVPLKLNKNTQQIQNYINYKIAERVSSQFYLTIMKGQLFTATNLLTFLKKQYDIE